MLSRFAKIIITLSILIPPVFMALIYFCLKKLERNKIKILNISSKFGLFGYYFYKVTTVGGISYVLITKRKISNVVAIKTVIIVSDYILIDVTN